MIATKVYDSVIVTSLASRMSVRAMRKKSCLGGVLRLSTFFIRCSQSLFPCWPSGFTQVTVGYLPVSL